MSYKLYSIIFSKNVSYLVLRLSSKKYRKLWLPYLKNFYSLTDDKTSIKSNFYLGNYKGFNMFLSGSDWISVFNSTREINT